MTRCAKPLCASLASLPLTKRPPTLFSLSPVIRPANELQQAPSQCVPEARLTLRRGRAPDWLPAARSPSLTIVISASLL